MESFPKDHKQQSPPGYQLVPETHPTGPELELEPEPERGPEPGLEPEREQELEPEPGLGLERGPEPEQELEPGLEPEQEAVIQKTRSSRFDYPKPDLTNWR